MLLNWLIGWFEIYIPVLVLLGYHLFKLQSSQMHHLKAGGQCWAVVPLMVNDFHLKLLDIFMFLQYWLHILKEFKHHVVYHHFKMDTLGTIKQLITEICFMVISDLNKAYNRIPVQLTRHWLQGRQIRFGRKDPMNSLVLLFSDKSARGSSRSVTSVMVVSLLFPCALWLDDVASVVRAS